MKAHTPQRRNLAGSLLLVSGAGLLFLFASQIAPSFVPSMVVTGQPVAGAVHGAATEIEPTIPTAPAPGVPVRAKYTPGTEPARTNHKPPATAVEARFPSRQRLCLAAAGLPVTAQIADALGFGAYLDWSVGPDRYESTDVEFVPMVRLIGGVASPGGEALLSAVDAQPGALWLIGNEPDVKWQDNVTAIEYVRLYHDLYYLLKARDPSSRVAVGGVSQPTPLRLRYLDQVLKEYRHRYGEPMPVDVWNVHNFVLREERASWGVDIPPGMADSTGELWEITDHGDLAIFQQQIRTFRRWMKERGQQNRPLLVSEYGILMPPDYGFPQETVEAFMLATFDFLGGAADTEVGYPEDGNRLVQGWCWFSLSDSRYPTGNLMQKDGRLTALGRAYSRYAESLHTAKLVR